MDEEGFRKSLEDDEGISSKKAITSRLSRARKAENILDMDLDTVVSSDFAMLEAMEMLQDYEDPFHNPMQNAVRKYYKFRNGKEFPKKRDCKI